VVLAPGLDEQTLLVQLFDDGLLDGVRRASLEVAVARHEAPRLVDRRQHRQPMDA
jgi:hypothetical protein